MCELAKGTQTHRHTHAGTIVLIRDVSTCLSLRGLCEMVAACLRPYVHSNSTAVVIAVLGFSVF